MKKRLCKLLAIICAIVSLTFAASCELLGSLSGDLNDILDKVAKTLSDVTNIVDNFENFTSPVKGDGTVTDKWSGTEFDAAFTMPEENFTFTAGYFEENEYGTLHTNSGIFSSIEDMDAYVDMLMEAGFETYNTFDKTFYSLSKSIGKAAIALKKGDIYVQLAFVADMNPNSAFNIASYDLVAVAMNNDK